MRRSLSGGVVARYAIGSIGTGGFGTLPGLVLVFYLTDTLGVTALAAGLVVAVAKVWDVVIDPWIGGRSDAALAVRGSRRPAMIVGSIALPVLFLLTFAVPAGIGPAASGIWVAVAFIATATAFSLFQVPYIALPAELTGDYDERTRLLAWRVVVLAIAILLFGAGGPLLRQSGADEYSGYLVMALVAGLVIGAGMLVASFVAPRWPDGRAAIASPPGIRRRASASTGYAAGLLALRRSTAFRTLLGAFVLQGLATGLMLAAANYVAVWVLHSDDALTFLFVALIAPAVLGAPLWSAVARGVGKERGFVLASLVFGVAAAALVGMAWAPGAWVYAPVALAGAGYAGMQSLPMAMLPDVVTDDARRHGDGRAGAFAGVWTAGETTGMALGATVLTIVLAVTGYLESTGAEIVEQPAEAVAGIVVAFSIVPAALVALSLLVFWRYPLRRGDVEGGRGGAGRGSVRGRRGRGSGRMKVPFAESPESVLDHLVELRSGDAPTHGGRVLSYVYDSGVPELDELAARAARLVQPVNGLDPTTFGSVAAMERELVGFARRVLGGGEDVVGSVTSGGTESCLLAVKTARDDWRRRGGTGIPRLVAPTTAHAAFHKAAHYLGLGLDLVPVDPATGTPRLADVEARLGPGVALLVGSAPSYPVAALDPIDGLAELALHHGVDFHVDACIGGFALAFRPSGSTPPWDLRVDGVTSLSADLHKYGYAPKGVSVLLQRGRDRQRQQYFATTEWPGYPVVNPTMTGSKPAGPLAAAWAIARSLGEAGFAELAGRAERATLALRETVAGIDGLRVVGEPVGPLFAVAADEAVPTARRVDPHRWADAVRGAGFQLQLQPGLGQSDGTRLPRTTHLTVTPVTETVLPELIPALEAAADAVRGIPAVEPGAVLGALAAAVPAAVLTAPDELDSETAAGVLTAAGLFGADAALPAELAPVLALVEALPAPLTERLLVELLARVVEPRD